MSSPLALNPVTHRVYQNASKSAAIVQPSTLPAHLRFGAEAPDKPAPDAPPPQNPPAAPKPAEAPPPGMVSRSFKFMKKFVKKFTSVKTFKQSVAQGYKEGKEDLKKSLKSGSTLKAVGRIGAESLGLVVAIVFLPMPGPNPAWFISPTSRAFFKGFIKDPEETRTEESKGTGPTPPENPPSATGGGDSNVKPPAAEDPEKKAS